MATSEILGLQWLEHPNIFNQAIVDLRNKSSFTDATLACEGKFYPVHKFVLSTCSEYFNAIFEWTPCVNPVVVINNISSHHLEPLLDFMYRGETNVQECYIQDVMKAAECLHIKGLSLKQYESNVLKNKAKSPISIEEPKKKRRKSEVKKKSSFLKPQVQSEVYAQQEPSPLYSSASSTRPTPTPPTTPIHQTSPHHTPSLHSPSVHSVHSASPLALSSCASSPSHTSFQQAGIQIPSPKPPMGPVTSHLQSQLMTNQNQYLKNIPPFRESSTSSPSQLPNLQQHQPMEVFSSHPRDQFSCMKEEQTNMVFSTLPNVITARDSSGLPVVTQEASSHQFRRYDPPASALHDRLMHGEGLHHGGVQSGKSTLTHMDQKMIGIGEELHLDGPVKELEIATEDGTVSIPEILEGLVDMRHLYDSKGDGFSHDSNPPGMEILPHCSTSGPPVNLLHFKEETNESMYEFTEDFHEEEGVGKMKLLKEKTFKVYSNNGTSLKRKYNSSDQSSEPSSPPPRLFGFGESSSRNTTPTASSNPFSSPSAGGESREDPRGEATFVCDVCAKAYKKKDALTRHKRIHTEFPYTCRVCQHKFKAYKEFIIHRKTHATKRCDQCDFVAIRNDNLRRHMVTHTEDKTHKCTYPDCAYTTSRLNLLTSHVQNNHTNKKDKKARKEAEK